jgi:NDP-sugar pyrophosphorylase family protein
MSAEDLAAVVLAGTHHWTGSRFERLAPRPLLPVALAPLMSYSLRWLRQGGIRRATICTNRRAVEAAFADGRELEMELGYSRDAMPRGPAGCVRDAGLRTGAGTLVVTDGTAIPTADFTELLGAHLASGAALTAVVHGEGSSSPTPGGVYVFDRRALAHVAPSGFQDIKEDLIPRLRRAGERVAAHLSDGLCPQVVDARTYLAVNEWMLHRLAHEDGGALVHATACVEPGARLVGPVQLGAGARVAAGATIVGPTSIGPGSTVGRDAVVSCSVVGRRCVMAEESLLHACVMGDDAVVPSWARLFNAVNPPASAAGLAPARARALSGAADPECRVSLPGFVLTSRTIG